MAKYDCLKSAIEITKEAASAGNLNHAGLIVLLESAYKKLVELEKDFNKVD